MPQREILSQGELAVLAKKFRTASGKTRSEAARDLGVARPTLIQAEDSPQKSLFHLRKRIIEKYSPYRVIGPVCWIEPK